MPTSVKLANDAFIKDARAAAKTCGRTLADQITYWAKIGRAIENSNDFSHTRIAQLLAGAREQSDKLVERRPNQTMGSFSELTEAERNELADFLDETLRRI